jgi:hypothetical protein
LESRRGARAVISGKATPSGSIPANGKTAMNRSVHDLLRLAHKAYKPGDRSADSFSARGQTDRGWRGTGRFTAPRGPTYLKNAAGRYVTSETKLEQLTRQIGLDEKEKEQSGIARRYCQRNG